MTLDDLLDASKAGADIPTDAALARQLGVGKSTVMAYRRGIAMPSPGHVVSLAKLAGVPAVLALAWRVGWQADTPAAKEVAEMLAQIVAKAGTASVIFLLAVLALNSTAAQETRPIPPPSIYYGK